MKRRPLILVTVLVGSLAAVVLPNWHAVWLAVAYEKTPMDSPWESMYYLKKRPSWLPGRGNLVPPQSCGYCRRQSHRRCSTTIRGVDGNWVQLHVKLVEGQNQTDWHCTCLDPSHSTCRFCLFKQHESCEDERCTCTDLSHERNS